MKHFLLAIILLLAPIVTSSIVEAQGPGGGAGDAAGLAPGSPCEEGFGCLEAPLPGVSSVVAAVAEQGLVSYIGVIAGLITAAIIVIGLISVVVGGYVYMTAGGDASRVGTAKTIISSALLGIVLALTAYLVLNTISPQFASEVKDPFIPAGNK